MRKLLVLLPLLASYLGAQNIDYSRLRNTPTSSQYDQSTGAPYSTFALACTAANTAGRSMTIDKEWTAVPSGTYTCPLVFVKGGKLTLAASATVALTSTITAAPLQIFDTAASGSSVTITGALLPEVYPEWWGTSTATLTTAAFNAAFLARGHVIFSSSSYTINGPVTIRDGLKISGVNNNRVTVTLSGATAGFVTGPNVTQVTVENFTIDCNNSAQIGFRWAGQQSGGTLDATELDFHDMEISKCTVAGFAGYHSYAVNLSNNYFWDSAINIKLEDGYNNTYQIRGGTVAGATSASAIYLGQGTSVFTYEAVACQSNAGTCIEINPTSGNSEMSFISPYFENNCVSLGGYNMKIDFNGYQSPARGIKLITPHFFTGTGCTQAALFESVADLSIDSPQWGSTTATKSIVIGRGALRPVLFSGNMGYVNYAGDAIVPTNGRNFAENLLRSSVALDTSVVSGAFAWATSNGTISQDATLGPDLGLTWKLTYAGASSASPALLRQPSSTITISGALVGCGVWARTDAGTSLAWAEITGTNTYTGSVANAHKVIVGTSWTWLWNSSGTDSADVTTFGCNFRAYDNSGSTAMYFQKPQTWRNTAATPMYISTTTGIFNRASNSVGHTVFAQLGNAAVQQPVICDDCTIANPTLGGGGGAFVIPIGSAWVGK